MIELLSLNGRRTEIKHREGLYVINVYSDDDSLLVQRSAKNIEKALFDCTLKLVEDGVALSAHCRKTS